MFCSEQDEWESSRSLFEAVRAAVDPSVSVRWHEEDWSVSVDWVVVGSVEEAVAITGEQDG